MKDRGTFEGGITVTAKDPGYGPQFGNAAAVGSGAPRPGGGGGGIPFMDKLMGPLKSVLGPIGQVLGAVQTISGIAGGAQPDQKQQAIGWDSMPAVSPGQTVEPGTAGRAVGQGMVTQPFLPGGQSEGAKATAPIMTAFQKNIGKGSSDGAKGGEKQEGAEEKADGEGMNGWEKAAMAASVASGLLNTQGPGLPRVGFSPGAGSVSDRFMV